MPHCSGGGIFACSNLKVEALNLTPCTTYDRLEAWANCAGHLAISYVERVVHLQLRHRHAIIASTEASSGHLGEVLE